MIKQESQAILRAKTSQRLSLIWSEIQRSGPIGLKMSDLVRFLYARDVVEDNWNLDQAPIQIIEMQVLPIELRNWN